MNKQEKINALGAHFTDFNNRMQTDMLFNNCIRILVEEQMDVYQLIEVLIEQNKELVGINENNIPIREE